MPRDCTRVDDALSLTRFFFMKDSDGYEMEVLQWHATSETRTILALLRNHCA